MMRKNPGGITPWIVRIIRWSGECVLVYLVYTETGPWTTVFAGLTAFSLEIQTAINQIQGKANFAVGEVLEYLDKKI